MTRGVGAWGLGLAAGGLALVLGVVLLMGGGRDELGVASEHSPSTTLPDDSMDVLAGAEVLDQRVHPYRDPHEGGRVVALVDVSLELELSRSEAPPDEAARARLRLRPSAIGPLVDPVRGVRGVRGANHQAARELDAITEEGELSLRIESAEGELVELDLASLLDGGSEGVSRGHLPERRVRPDGSLDFDARTSASYTTALELLTPSVGAGRHTAEVVVRGDVRLAVDFELEHVNGELVGHITSVRGAAASDDRELPLDPDELEIGP